MGTASDIVFYRIFSTLALMATIFITPINFIRNLKKRVYEEK